MTERKTVAGAYAKLEGHERECALRYEALGQGISEVKATLKWVLVTAAGVLISLVGYLGHVVING